MEATKNRAATHGRQGGRQAPSLEGAAHEPQLKVGFVQNHTDSDAHLQCIHLNWLATLYAQSIGEYHESISLDMI
jgi:hypothetical protein